MNRLLHFASKVLFPSNPKEGVLGSVDFNLTLAKAAGYPYPVESGKCSQYAHYFYCVLAVLGLGIIYVVFELLDLYYSLHDIDALASNACLTFSHVSGAFKMFNLIFHRNEVQDIINTFKKLTIAYVKSKTQESAFYKGELENKLPLLFYVSIVSFTGFLAVIYLLASELLQIDIYLAHSQNDVKCTNFQILPPKEPHFLSRLCYLELSPSTLELFV